MHGVANDDVIYGIVVAAIFAMIVYHIFRNGR